MSFLSRIFSSKPEQKVEKQPAKIVSPCRVVNQGCPVCIAERGYVYAWNGMVVSESGDIDKLCLEHRAALNQKLDDIKTGKFTLEGITEDGKDFLHNNQNLVCNFLILTAMHRGASNDEQKAYWKDVFARWYEGAVDYCNHYGGLCGNSRREEQAKERYRQEHRNDPLF